MNNHRYSFLVSSDEVMYLRMDVKEVQYRDKTVFHEPRLHYSKPLKIADIFDAKEGRITVRMGLFHLFWLAIQNDRLWQLPDEMGNCLNYATFTGEEEDLEPPRPTLPGFSTNI